MSFFSKSPDQPKHTHWCCLMMALIFFSYSFFFYPPPFRRKARGHGVRLSMMRYAWFRICSRYLVSATPPTVLGGSFWNFTGVSIMVWRYACAFTESWNNFFQIFHIFNLDFFSCFDTVKVYMYYGPCECNPPTVLYHSHWNYRGVLTIVWRYAYAFYRILKLLFFYFFHIFFHASILWKCI